MDVLVVVALAVVVVPVICLVTRVEVACDSPGVPQLFPSMSPVFPQYS